jgi:hypothetical protein
LPGLKWEVAIQKSALRNNLMIGLLQSFFFNSFNFRLMMDTPLVFGQLIPIGVMTIMGLTIIEVKIKFFLIII